MKTCPTCSREFKPRGGNQTYCEPDCFPKCLTCGRDGYYASGYCRLHWRRVQRDGDPGGTETLRPERSKECAVKGCERPHRARGFCTTHLYRLDSGLPLDDEVRQYERDGKCTVKGCEKRRHKSADFCARHASRYRRQGDPGGAERLRAAAGEATWTDPEVMRAKHLLENYGLTLDDYDRMAAEQRDCCRSCGKDKSAASPRSRSQRWMVVDHDHRCCPGKRSCGKCVRGLLCQHCNRGGGFFGDDPERLERHAAYLRETARFPLIEP